MKLAPRNAHIGLSAAAMLALAGCSAIPTPEAPPPPAPQPVAPTPAPTPAPVTPAKPWDERAVDVGAWRYDTGSRTAAFVPTGSASPLVSLACAGGSIRLTADVGEPGQASDVHLQTSAGTDRLRLDSGAVILSARDPRLDRIAFSRGRFAIEADNDRALTLPVQSEIGRVIEDCRG